MLSLLDTHDGYKVFHEKKHLFRERILTESSPIELSRRLILLLFELATFDVIIER